MHALSPTAMILAAGHGMRLRPLTLDKPKPLLEVGGRAMLDLALDKLLAAGVRRAVVNAHYLADQIENHLAARKDIEIIISREDELLDTGGGIKKALRHFDGLPFFVLNADLPWTERGEPSLSRMAAAWDSAKMDALLLLLPVTGARGFGAHPRGDFALDHDGHARRHNITQLSHVMLAAQITRPELFAARAERVFSNNLIWDEAESKDRLYGVEHRGACHHVGTPEDWRTANALLASGQGWDMARP